VERPWRLCVKLNHRKSTPPKTTEAHAKNSPLVIFTSED